MPQAAAPRQFAKSQNFREVGLHQCPSERKGEGVPVRSLRVPSHVPSHPQTAAKARGFSPIASGFTAETDWLLEQAGFETSVPLTVNAVRGHVCRGSAQNSGGRRCGLKLRQDRPEHLHPRRRRVLVFVNRARFSSAVRASFSSSVGSSVYMARSTSSGHAGTYGRGAIDHHCRVRMNMIAG